MRLSLRIEAFSLVTRIFGQLGKLSPEGLTSWLFCLLVYLVNFPGSHQRDGPGTLLLGAF